MLHHLSTVDMVVDLYFSTLQLAVAESQLSLSVLPLSTHIKALLATISKI